MEKHMKKTTAMQLTTMGLMTALMCVLAPLSIQLPGLVPISLGSFIVYLTVYIVGLEYAAVSNVVYILLGAFGLPVFSGYVGGLAKLTGPTGGYIIGFIAVTIVCGIALKVFKGNIVAFFAAMVVGTALLYLLGTLWFMHVMGTGLQASLTACVYPFIPFDLVKMVIVCILGPAVRIPLVKAGLLKSYKTN